MSWPGYFTYDGAEIINSSRTEAYARLKPWFKAVIEAEMLADGLDHAPYTDPVTDEAPWYDPDDEASGKFLGVYPINVTGIEDSTRASTVVESTEDGAVPGRIRHGSKSPVFSVMLLADDEAGAEYGLRWLRRALLGDVCSDTLATNTALGSTLGYLASEPKRKPSPAAGAIETLDALRRNLRRVVFNSGPTVLARYDNLTCGGSAWNVQFTAVAGIPFEFSDQRALIQGYLDPSVVDPWAPGVVAGDFDTVSAAFEEVACPDNLWDPIYDPLCPALIVPPAPPSVPLGCFEPPATWDRYKITIPAENVPLWGEVVPVIEVYAASEVRNVRLRFYQDADGTFDPDEAPCSYRGDVVISYIPAEGSVILDGASKEVFVDTANGQRRRADSLVFRTDGKPFQWPSLTCGFQHILTVDTDPGAAVLPVIDLSLVQRVV